MGRMRSENNYETGKRAQAGQGIIYLSYLSNPKTRPVDSHSFSF